MKIADRIVIVASIFASGIIAGMLLTLQAVGALNPALLFNWYATIGASIDMMRRLL